LWFDKLTTNGNKLRLTKNETNPFALSLSKGVTRPNLNSGTGSPKCQWSRGMNLRYDPEVDALYISFKQEPIQVTTIRLN
jgi:hypothetical protein